MFFVFVSDCLHASINYELKDHKMLIIVSVLVWNDIYLPSANWSQSVLGASCWWIRECCSHNRPFFMWPSAIFPSLHHGPKNPKTNVTTTQACGSPLFSTLSHPNRPDEALCGCDVMGQFSLPELPVKFQFTCSDRAEQLTIINEHCPLQPTLILWRSSWVCMLLRLQGQKWLIKRSSFRKHWSDNLMWHTRVTMRVLLSSFALELPPQWYYSGGLGPQRWAVIHC